MSTILAVGSMAFDSIQTPFGKVDKILGGSLNYFSLAAGQFAKVKAVSVVGEDYPREHLDLLKTKNVDISGVQIEKGKTFHWTGKYSFDLHEAETLGISLNVFEKFYPTLPEPHQSCPFVFLGNISPELQAHVLNQVKNPQFIAIDSMNYWIEGARESLLKVISRCHCLILNEGEIRQLTKSHNLVQAAHMVRQLGPQILVVKRGEYGAVLFDHGEVFSTPGLPLSEVKDPTGAGDTFAGGLMGYLASLSHLSISRKTLRQAIVYGNVMASFTVQDFGFKELLTLNSKRIRERYQQFVDLTSFQV